MVSNGGKQKVNKITKSKIEKYYKITKDALDIAKKSLVQGKNKENFEKIGKSKFSKKNFAQISFGNRNYAKFSKQAKEIFLMVECYLSDAKHFQEKENFVNAYGCINYAHGWLDCGARLKIFKVKDDRLFTV